MTPPVIHWFRQDLRLDDNPALAAAAVSGAPVIALYIHDDVTPSPWKTGGASRWWLHHSLAALNKSIGGKLVMRTGRADDVLKTVIQQTGARAVYWNRQYEPFATSRDAGIKAALKAAGIEAHSHKAGALWEPWEIRTNSGTPFRVFTPFYKACLASEALIGAAVKPVHAKSFLKPPLESEAPDLLPRINWDKGFAPVWTPGEKGAWERAQDFIETVMPDYKSGRDRPDRESTSRLSPHLHFGEISPRALWHAANGRKGAEPFLREIAWREFSIHLLYHNPDLPSVPLQPRFADFPWQEDARLLRAWQRGETGYPIVDAGMRQLWETGWMHNRVRMIAASLLVKHLLQPWQAGEAWFWDTLVDADLANNAASWQWIGGCGADAAPYFRVFNPILQGLKFDPDGDYVRRFVPELRGVPTACIHKPWESGMTLDYPAPVIGHGAGRERALEAFAKLKNNEA